MLFVEIYLTVLLVISAILYVYLMTSKNKDHLYGYVPAGWWITSIGFAQFFFVAIPFLWGVNFGWYTTALNISLWVSIASLAIYAIMRYLTRAK